MHSISSLATVFSRNGLPQDTPTPIPITILGCQPSQTNAQDEVENAGAELLKELAKNHVNARVLTIDPTQIYYELPNGSRDNDWITTTLSFNADVNYPSWQFKGIPGCQISQYTPLKLELKDLEKTFAVLKHKSDDLTQKLKAVGTELEQLQKQSQECARQLTTLRAEKSASSQSSTKMLLGMLSASPDRTLNSATALTEQELVARQQAITEQLQEKYAEYSELRAPLRETNSALKDLNTQLERCNDKIEKLYVVMVQTDSLTKLATVSYSLPQEDEPQKAWSAGFSEDLREPLLKNLSDTVQVTPIIEPRVVQVRNYVERTYTPPSLEDVLPQRAPTS